jgi:hypothetical protein
VPVPDRCFDQRPSAPDHLITSRPRGSRPGQPRFAAFAAAARCRQSSSKARRRGA